ncbi:hypothetical protein [Halococcus sediminicola]|uniref:hypothetical protein n=1 Tax=Halococcus sediminicola TaxID=1264579 RepID=UPI0006794ADA|nr:hypothetical protein [Halococcus sediminicola]
MRPRAPTAPLGTGVRRAVVGRAIVVVLTTVVVITLARGANVATDAHGPRHLLLVGWGVR